MMRAILVDDEHIALDILESLLSPYEDVEIVGKYIDPMTALEEMNTTQPDVIFLDIEMGPINGLAMADEFTNEKNSIEIVFITAYSQYAIDAFELNVMDYLLKPIQQNRLEKTVKRLRNRFNSIVIEIDNEDNFLKVDCFGNLEATNSSGKLLNWRTRKSKELFAYLLVQKGMQVSKDLIMETIFPEKDLEKATTLLHTTIYQLRTNLRRLGFNKSILYLNGWYQLNITVDSDFEKLDNLLNLKDHSIEDILEIINIYKGNFLEYDGYHWALSIQQKYKELVLSILNNFTKNQLEKNIDSSILNRTLETIYRIDPFDDKMAENMIEYLGKQGQLNKLKGFYKHYKDSLWKELNIKPMERTSNLYKKYCHSID